MTAWAETWAPTPREKLTRDALPGLSSWDLVVATAFTFLLVSDIFIQAAAGNGISAQLWQPGGRKSIVPCSGPSWEVSSCLPAQPTAPLHACTSLCCFGELMTGSFLSQLLSPRNRAAEVPAAQEGRAAQTGFSQSVSVCLSTKEAADCD